MGKASQAKRNRGTRRSRADLLSLLAESQQFLEVSSRAFDDGFDGEAKRLAVTLRVLLHDTNQSHSLLTQLGVKGRLGFVDTAEPINPNNLAPTPGLVLMRLTTTHDGPAGKYVAPLDMERPSSSRVVPFAGWWNNAVMKVDGTWSRSQLVLALANREGGAHVDPDLNERYESLAKSNGLGWTAVSGGTSRPFTGDPTAEAVRQITYEVLETLRRDARLLT